MPKDETSKPVKTRAERKLEAQLEQAERQKSVAPQGQAPDVQHTIKIESLPQGQAVITDLNPKVEMVKTPLNQVYKGTVRENKEGNSLVDVSLIGGKVSEARVHKDEAALKEHIKSNPPKTPPPPIKVEMGDHSEQSVKVRDRTGNIVKKEQNLAPSVSKVHADEAALRDHIKANPPKRDAPPTPPKKSDEDILREEMAKRRGEAVGKPSKAPEPVNKEVVDRLKATIQTNDMLKEGLESKRAQATGKAVTKDSLGVPAGAQFQGPPEDPALKEAMTKRRAEVTGKPIVKGSPGVPIADKIAAEGKSKTNSSFLIKVAIACAAVAAIAVVIAILAAINIITLGAAVLPTAVAVAAVAGGSSAFFAYKSNPATAGPKVGPENKADTDGPDLDDPKSPPPTPTGR